MNLSVAMESGKKIVVKPGGISALRLLIQGGEPNASPLGDKLIVPVSPIQLLPVLVPPKKSIANLPLKNVSIIIAKAVIQK